MVLFAYQIDRAILLALISGFLVICALQILASKRLNFSEAKYRTHYWNFLSATLLLVATIDHEALFNIYHSHLAFSLLTMMSGQFVIRSFCLIIINHFRAHYLSLKQPFPDNFSWLLALPVVLGSILLILSQSLTWSYQSNKFMIIGYINSFLEVISIMSLDLIGYHKIFLLLIDLIRADKPNYQGAFFLPRRPEAPMKRASTRSSNINKTDYESLLYRIWKFHAFAVITLNMYLISVAVQIYTDVKRGLEKPPLAADPNIYSFNYISHFILPGLFMLTWWAWIPLSQLWEISTSNASTTALSEYAERPKSPSVPSGREGMAFFPEAHEQAIDRSASGSTSQNTTSHSSSSQSSTSESGEGGLPSIPLTEELSTSGKCAEPQAIELGPVGEDDAYVV